MSGDFFDSNVLIYMFDKRNPAKQLVAAGLVVDGTANSATISFQVVQETLAVMTRKIENPATPEEARAFMNDVLIPLWEVMPTAELYIQALEIQQRYGFHFYDALIVAAALSAGCTRLLSEDLQDGQRIEGLTIVNPFK